LSQTILEKTCSKVGNSFSLPYILVTKVTKAKKVGSGLIDIPAILSMSFGTIHYRSNYDLYDTNELHFQARIQAENKNGEISLSSQVGNASIGDIISELISVNDPDLVILKNRSKIKYQSINLEKDGSMVKNELYLKKSVHDYIDDLLIRGKYSDQSKLVEYLCFKKLIELAFENTKLGVIFLKHLNFSDLHNLCKVEDNHLLKAAMKKALGGAYE
jgi:hypothetical protein